MTTSGTLLANPQNPVPAACRLGPRHHHADNNPRPHPAQQKSPGPTALMNTRTANTNALYTPNRSGAPAYLPRPSHGATCRLQRPQPARHSRRKSALRLPTPLHKSTPATPPHSTQIALHTATPTHCGTRHSSHATTRPPTTSCAKKITRLKASLFPHDPGFAANAARIPAPGTPPAVPVSPQPHRCRKPETRSTEPPSRGCSAPHA